MTTDDTNKKNTPGEKTEKTNKEELPDEGNPNDKVTGEKTEPAEEEIESTSAMADTGLLTEPDNNVVREATPQEIEEANIDEEETEFSSTTNCRCQEIDGEYYCFRLKQGGWIQWSVIPYPTKKMCEAICCKT